MGSHGRVGQGGVERPDEAAARRRSGRARPIGVDTADRASRRHRCSPEASFGDVDLDRPRSGSVDRRGGRRPSVDCRSTRGRDRANRRAVGRTCRQTSEFVRRVAGGRAGRGQPSLSPACRERWGDAPDAARRESRRLRAVEHPVRNARPAVWDWERYDHGGADRVRPTSTIRVQVGLHRREPIGAEIGADRSATSMPCCPSSSPVATPRTPRVVRRRSARSIRGRRRRTVQKHWIGLTQPLSDAATELTKERRPTS